MLSMNNLPKDVPLPRIGTLGMFIMDHFHYLKSDGTPEDPPDRGLTAQVGGGGTYVAVATSMWIAPNRMYMLVDRGSDWQADWQRQLDQYVDSSMLRPGEVGIWAYRSRGEEKTTLALNVFNGETRGFEYLTPKLRIHPKDLIMKDFELGKEGLPEVIHLVCSPERAASICIESREYAANDQGAFRNGEKTDLIPTLIWEPMPSDAIPANLDACLGLFDQVHVFSPNHEEAACLLSVDLPSEKDQAAMIATVEGMVSKLLTLASYKSKLTRTPIIGLRSGKNGTYIEPAHAFKSAEAHAAPTRTGFWVPAYHDASMAHRVVDVTGGGNGWLGGFASGIADAVAVHPKMKAMTDKDVLLDAGVRASVSASYMIEQLSLPPASNFRPGATAVGAKEGEDEGVQARYERLYNRITKP